jgi:hypothetical protein
MKIGSNLDIQFSTSHTNHLSLCIYPFFYLCVVCVASIYTLLFTQKRDPFRATKDASRFVVVVSSSLIWECFDTVLVLCVCVCVCVFYFFHLHSIHHSVSRTRTSKWIGVVCVVCVCAPHLFLPHQTHRQHTHTPPTPFPFITNNNNKTQ